ncbi:MAG: PHP domain-containing protein [Candidatus Nanoarchaeia archaeon]|nr:PHP domain-containing protein [Candidatus Nanoarchaeia archaeon]
MKSLPSEEVDILKLKNEGLFFDMHFHTKYSDGSANIDTIARICKKNNIGVAITDHNEIRGAVLANAEEINSIPGIEIRSSENVDMLFYFYKIGDLIEFYNKYIKPNKKLLAYAGLKLSAHEIFDYAKKYNAVSSLAHPFGTLSIGRSLHRSLKNMYIEEGQDKYNIIKKFDAIEVMNGHLMKSNNMKAFDLAEKYKKGYTAGSDGHVKFDLGTVLCYSFCKDNKCFLNNIKKKDVKVYYYSGRIARMLVSRSWALRKHAIHPIHYLGRVVDFGKRKIETKILNNKL